MPEHIPKIELLPLLNFIETIRGSIGSEQYRHLYARVDGEQQDLLDNGLKSCAFFVSNILSQSNFRLLPKPNATVVGLMRTLEAQGWAKVETPSLPGQVLIWETMQQADGKEHLHAGFFLEGEMAISHVDSTRTPQEHHFTFGVNEDGTPKRKLIAVYTHPFLMQ